MAAILYSSENEIDILDIQGILDDKAVSEIAQTISNLRQQSSTRLLIVGGGVERVAVNQWKVLDKPLRNYRHLGGRIALAEFQEMHLHLMRYPSWFQYVNTFKTKMEALMFLDPIDID